MLLCRVRPSLTADKIRNQMSGVLLSSTKLADAGLLFDAVGSASIMVRRLDEGVDLPDLVQQQAQAEGWHLRVLAAPDHRFQKALFAGLCREEVPPPRAGLWWQT